MVVVVGVMVKVEVVPSVQPQDHLMVDVEGQIRHGSHCPAAAKFLPVFHSFLSQANTQEIYRKYSYFTQPFHTE